jgi:hypothetical protein
MFKHGTCALLVAGLVATGLSAPANASVVYSLTFDNYGTTVEGTGTLTLNLSTLASAYNLNTSSTSVFTSVSTSNIDGNGTFFISPTNLSGFSIDTGNVGQIYSLTVTETEPTIDQTSGDVLFLDLYTNTWQIHGQYNSTIDQGDLLIAGPSLSSTPLPGSLPLFASSLGFVGYLLSRRKAKIAPRPAATA